MGVVDDLPAEAVLGLLQAASDGAGTCRTLSRHERSRVLDACAALVERYQAAFADLIAGHVQLSFMTVLEASGHLKAGKLRVLVVTSDQRVAVLPGVNAVSGLGLLAPAGTPPETVEKAAADVGAVLADEALKTRFASLGGVAHAMTPKACGQLIADDRRRYAQIIRERGVTVD